MEWFHIEKIDNETLSRICWMKQDQSLGRSICSCPVFNLVKNRFVSHIPCEQFHFGD